MNLLSHETEMTLKFELLELVENYLKVRKQVPERITGLITPNQLQDELEIKYKTLQRWENAGLRRYQPPLEDTRKIFYRVVDVLKFLGVE